MIGVGFLASPAVQAMGVGFLGLQMPTMIVTVLIAHLVYGLILGFLLRRWLPEALIWHRHLIVNAPRGEGAVAMLGAPMRTRTRWK